MVDFRNPFLTSPEVKNPSKNYKVYGTKTGRARMAAPQTQMARPPTPPVVEAVDPRSTQKIVDDINKLLDG